MSRSAGRPAHSPMTTVSACSVKSAVLAMSERCSISRGREPRETNSGDVASFNNLRSCGEFPKGGSVSANRRVAGPSKAVEAIDIARNFARHGGCLTPCFKSIGQSTSQPISTFAFSFMPRPLRWSFWEGRRDALFDRFARHHVRRSREGDDLLQAQAGERWEERLDQRGSLGTPSRMSFAQA